MGVQQSDRYLQYGAEPGDRLSVLNKNPASAGFLSVMLKVLNVPLMLSGSVHGVECTQVSSFPRFGVDLAGIDAILPRFQFPYHNLRFLR